MPNDPISGKWDKDSVAPITHGFASGKIGVYYNYCAASAGSYCYANNAQTTDPNPASLIDIDGDICPAGWRLPTSTNAGEFQNLYDEYANNSAEPIAEFLAAFSVSYSGYTYSAGRFMSGDSATFWSSSWASSYEAYSAEMHDNAVYMSRKSAAPVSHRDNYESIRCIVGV